MLKYTKTEDNETIVITNDDGESIGYIVRSPITKLWSLFDKNNVFIDHNMYRNDLLEVAEILNVDKDKLLNSLTNIEKGYFDKLEKCKANVSDSLRSDTFAFNISIDIILTPMIDTVKNSYITLNDRDKVVDVFATINDFNYHISYYDVITFSSRLININSTNPRKN